MGLVDKSQRADVPDDWRQAMIGAHAHGAATWPAHDASPKDRQFFRGLARAFVLAKQGQVVDARRELDAIESEWERKDSLSVQKKLELILVDAHVRAYEGRIFAAADIANLKWTLEAVPSDDFVAQGLALNQLCIACMHSGHLDRAQEYGESAIRAYRQGAAELGSLHLLAHLGQIKLMRGDLEGAAQEYSIIESSLLALPSPGTALLAVSRALRSEVAYETNDLVESETLLESAIGSIEENDAWLDVRAAAYRVRIRLAFNHLGLPGALSELSHFETAAENLKMPRLLRLIRFERIRVLTLSDEIDAAIKIMRSMDIDPQRLPSRDDDDWAFRQGSTAVAISRWLVRARRAREALAFMETVEDFAIRRGQLLSLAKLRVIRAEAHWRLNQKSEATSALLSSVRLLGNQPFRRFILDEGQEVSRIVQAVLDGDHMTSPVSRQQRARFAELHHYSTVQKREARRVGPGSPSEVAGGHPSAKYLELLALGLSNKEIARTMGVTVNTVKYHLKTIFRELRVLNRTQAVMEATRLRIINQNHPDR